MEGGLGRGVTPVCTLPLCWVLCDESGLRLSGGQAQGAAVLEPPDSGGRPESRGSFSGDLSGLGAGS